ncbi:tetratricopeptide repeat protein [Dactylosporangium sp. NPDC005572]|uniref:tetratricopeptide repeat protein n=1 Tax=Dactylosporangium sp. NPDC005572 TaxID=3156889 RepID=UPI0033A42ACE
MDATLDERLDELDRRGLGQAETLLRMLCLLPATPVPRSVLAADLMARSELFWGLTAPRLDELVEALASAGLVQGGDRLLRLDEATAAAAHAGLDRSGQLPACVALWATLLFVATADSEAGVADDPAAADAWEMLTPLVLRVFAHLVDDATHQDPRDVDLIANACLHATEYLASAGRTAQARDAAAAVFDGCRLVLGPDEHRTLLALAFLGSWTGHAGDPEGACAHYARFLEASVRRNGEDDEDSDLARINLATWTGRAGRPAEAGEHCAALVRIRERVHGPEHPRTLTARASLAHWTGEAGDPAGARDRYGELLPLAERVWGPEHPETVSIREAVRDWQGLAEAG